jgi:hypothetical protein
MSARLFLSTSHPLAHVAAERCQDHKGPLVGGVACGRCWEQAIRDDERVVVEFDLPRDLSPDPFYVDIVAVERACDGERVVLTEPELAAAIRALQNRGLAIRAIAKRLNVPERDVTRGGVEHLGRRGVAA